MKEKTVRESRVSRFKTAFSNIFKFRYWLDFDRNRNFALYVVQVMKRILYPEAPELTETFGQAKKRLHLTDEILLKQQTSLFRLSILMSIWAFFGFIYMFYQLFSAHFLAALISLVLTGLALTLAFRYHFWYFQIKKKKLGCSLHTWFHEGLLREKK